MDPTQALWDRIRAAGSECPLCRAPVELISSETSDVYLVKSHDFPVMVGTPSARGILNYAALRITSSADGKELSLAAQCPMSGQPARVLR